MDDFSWLKEALDKLDSKVDRLDQTLDNVSVLQVKNTVVLEEHQRRSLANEENVELLREQLKPIESHVNRVEFTFKMIAFLGTTIGVISGALKLFNVF